MDAATTHGHDDHFGAANDLKRKYGLLTFVMKEEEEAIISVRYNLSMNMGHPRVTEPDLFFIDNQTVPVLGTSMKTLLTPGHTVGGCCFYFKSAGVLFSGDTLFEESVGRSDFPTGSMRTLVRSVKERLFVLPDETIVYPGHNGDTTIGHEKKYNPFCG